MIYLLALLLPPLAILFVGRPFLAILVLLVWLPAILMSGGLGHPIFVLLAWLIVFRQEQRRARS